jgi:hypothetical protein
MLPIRYFLFKHPLYKWYGATVDHRVLDLFLALVHKIAIFNPPYLMWGCNHHGIAWKDYVNNNLPYYQQYTFHKRWYPYEHVFMYYDEEDMNVLLSMPRNELLEEVRAIWYIKQGYELLNNEEKGWYCVESMMLTIQRRSTILTREYLQSDSVKQEWHLMNREQWIQDMMMLEEER